MGNNRKMGTLHKGYFIDGRFCPQGFNGETTPARIDDLEAAGWIRCQEGMVEPPNSQSGILGFVLGIGVMVGTAYLVGKLTDK